MVNSLYCSIYLFLFVGLLLFLAFANFIFFQTSKSLINVLTTASPSKFVAFRTSYTHTHFELIRGFLILETKMGWRETDAPPPLILFWLLNSKVGVSNADAFLRQNLYNKCVTLNHGSLPFMQTNDYNCTFTLESMLEKKIYWFSDFLAVPSFVRIYDARDNISFWYLDLHTCCQCSWELLSLPSNAILQVYICYSHFRRLEIMYLGCQNCLAQCFAISASKVPYRLLYYNSSI